ncbi:MAG: trigger factor [Rhodospirillaceae bacterium]|nr:trigger factor [Rhodospirillaceae bacterium]
MQLNETKSDGLKREYKIVVESAEFDSAVDNRLKEIAKTANIKGFRPGKVPMSIIKQKYKQGILGEILQQTVQDSTRQALEEKSIRPAMEPKIEITKFDEGQDLEFTVAIEVMPDFEISDLSSLHLEKLKTDVSEDSIEDALKRILEAEKRFAKTTEERAAKNGDALLIDFSGQIDGKTTEGLSAKDYELELGSGSFIPGFEDQLIGSKSNQDQTVSVKFPDSYANEEMQGKEAIFNVSIKEVRERITSSLDDEMAKRHGFDDLKSLRNGVTERLKQEFEQASQARLKRTLLDKLAEQHDFNVPPSMVDQEFQQIWKQVTADVERDGRSFKEVTGDDEDQAKEEYQQIATRRVRLGLVLSEIGQKNNITVSQQDLAQAAMANASHMMSPEQIAEFYKANPQALERFQAPVYEDKVVAFIVELATVSERKVSRDELFSDPDDAKNTTKSEKNKKSKVKDKDVTKKSKKNESSGRKKKSSKISDGKVTEKEKNNPKKTKAKKATSTKSKPKVSTNLKK